MSGMTPVEVIPPEVGTVAYVTLVVDGINYLSMDTAPYLFQLDSRRFTNGVHTVQAIGYDASDVIVSGLESAPVDYDFANPISISWPDSFGEQLTVHADLIDTNADWWIDIADDVGDPVRSLSGSTTNASIDVVWDCTDDAGDPIAGNAMYWFTFRETRSTGGLAFFAAGASESWPTNFAMIGGWGEEPWTIRGTQTVIARQKVTCFPWISCHWDLVSAGKCNAARTDITGTPDPAEQPWGHPDIYGDGSVMEITSDATWSNTLLTALSAPLPGNSITMAIPAGSPLAIRLSPRSS